MIGKNGMNIKFVPCASLASLIFVLIVFATGFSARANVNSNSRSTSSSIRLLSISSEEVAYIKAERRCFDQLELRMLPLKCFQLISKQNREFAQQLDQICERLTEAWSEPAELYANLENISSVRVSNRCFQAIRRSLRDIRYRLSTEDPKKAVRIGLLEQDLLISRVREKAAVPRVKGSYGLQTIQ
jgi:uncharacterized membrane protein YccC